MVMPTKNPPLPGWSKLAEHLSCSLHFLPKNITFCYMNSFLLLQNPAGYHKQKERHAGVLSV
jgi:hypothetical protein